jgi:K+-transporting ATPase ATPase C chain
MKSVFIAIKFFLILTVLTGVIYPLFVTGIAQIIFPEKANGSLILQNNKIIGSELIGQQFDSVIYFTSRPSAVSYNPLPSGGSNFGITSEKLKQQVLERKQKFIEFNGLDNNSEIPSEMLFASASGLDPHISLQSALLQSDRISKARNFESAQKQKLLEIITANTEAPQFLIFGKQRVNVLKLNLETDKIKF